MSARSRLAGVRLAAVVATALASPGAAWAQWGGDSAEVLPEGLFTGMVNYVYTDTGVRTQQGAMSQAEQSAETNLLTDLVGPSSDFGSALIRYRASAQVIAPSLFYGVHDRVTVGFVVPIFLTARIDLHQLHVGTGAIGYNPDFTKDMDRQSPVLSSSDPRSLQGAEGVNRVLTDVFQYEPLGNWSNRGIADIQVLSRIKAHRSRHLRVAVQPGLQIPTGEPDDPDNLVDFGLGGGQWDVGGVALVDVVPTRWLTFNLRVGYTWQLANRQTARVYDDASIPLAPEAPLPEQYGNFGREREVRRDLGDMWQAGGLIRISRGVFFGGGSFDYQGKGADRYSSSEGDHPAMALGTAYRVKVVGGQLGVDFVESFLQGRSPLPVIFELTVQRSMSEREASNMTTAMTKATLYFGSSEAAKKKR